MTPVEQMKERALKLQSLIALNHPTMPVLLREIHTQIKADPELVTLADEETINLIVRGLIKQTGVEIATAVAKSKTKSVKQITLADL